MKTIMLRLKSGLESKILSEHYNYYCALMDSYEQAMEYLQITDPRAFTIFSDWFMSDGKNSFESVTDNIITEEIDTRFSAFMRTYKSYLEDAIEDECKEIVAEFLYMIPRQMEEDFQKFGFIDNQKREFIWEYEVIVNKNIDDYYIEPDSFCQVLLA